MKKNPKYYLYLIRKLSSRRRRRRDQDRLIRNQLKEKNITVEEEFNSMFQNDDIAEVAILNIDEAEVIPDSIIYEESFSSYISSLRQAAENEVDRIQNSNDLDAIQFRDNISATRRRFEEKVTSRHKNPAKINGLLNHFDKWPERLVENMMSERVLEDKKSQNIENEVNLSFLSS